MRVRVGVIVGLLALFALLIKAPAGRSSESDSSRVGPADVSPIMQSVFPALVQVSVIDVDPLQGREQKREISGSGVIVSPDGHVVTNHHVVGHAKRVWCTLPNHEEVDAELLGSDALTDIGVIKLVRPAGSKAAAGFPFARWGDSSKLAVGHRVFAMGSPLALSQTVTAGRVANTEMVLPRRWGGNDAFLLDDEPVGSVVRWIVHDAATAPGNSGGPVVDATGQIVGITEIGLFPPLGGAIPSNTARPVAEAIIKNGEVHRGWVGIEIQPLLKSHDGESGVLIRSVARGSSAERAGIRPGDILTRCEGQPVSIHHAEEVPDFNRRMFEVPVGQSVHLEISREGKSRPVTLITEERGKSQAQDREIKGLGITGRDITRLAALDMEREECTGVFISTVSPGGPVAQAKPPLEEGDIVVALAGQKIGNLSDLENVVRTQESGASKGESVIIEFARKAERCLSAVTVGVPGLEPGSKEAVKAWFPALTQVYTSQLASAQRRPDVRGVRITYLFPELEKGPFQVGDILTHIEGAVIDATQTSDSQVFETMVRQYAIGTKVEIRLLREGQPRAFSFVLPASPPGEREAAKYRDLRLECTFRDLVPKDRAEMKLAAGQGGALLQEVACGGWARVADLKVGDLVLGINERPVTCVADVERILKSLPGTGKPWVRFFVKRRGHTLFAESRPDR